MSSKQKIEGLKRYHSTKSSSSAKQGTVLDKIVAAIRALRLPNGSSRVAITKYLKSEFDYDNNNAIKNSLKKGVSTGVLEQTGQSFRVAGDAPIEDIIEGPQLEIKDIKIGGGDREAYDGDTVIVKYVGKLESGEKFDAASSFDFVLGAGDVIKGWDQVRLNVSYLLIVL